MNKNLHGWLVKGTPEELTEMESLMTSGTSVKENKEAFDKYFLVITNKSDGKNGSQKTISTTRWFPRPEYSQLSEDEYRKELCRRFPDMEEKNLCLLAGIKCPESSTKSTETSNEEMQDQICDSFSKRYKK